VNPIGVLDFSNM